MGERGSRQQCRGDWFRTRRELECGSVIQAGLQGLSTGIDVVRAIMSTHSQGAWGAEKILDDQPGLLGA